MKRNHFIQGGVVFAIALAISLAPLSARSGRSVDAGCRTREAEACPADSGPNPLLSLAGSCAMDLKRDRNCCVHRSDGPQDYAIVKDCAANKPEGYLLVPVKRITGMDDPQIFDPPFVGLWAEAWRWSREFPGQPAARTALAINSAGSRSEQQLHIHISCVRREVRDALQNTEIPWFPAKPRELSNFGPQHYNYRAVKVSKLTGKSSPFLVVMRQVGKSAMPRHGIALIGSSKEGEFFLLETSEEDGGGHAENLLDQRCEK